MLAIKKQYEYSPCGHALDAAQAQVVETTSGDLRARSSLGVEIAFPPDQRHRVADTTKFPWSSMGQLIMVFPNGKRYTGTATLIGGSHVTAARDVYGRDVGGFAKNV
jgi:V8-like Glu-specific endopeptidase